MNPILKNEVCMRGRELQKIQKLDVPQIFRRNFYIKAPLPPLNYEKEKDFGGIILEVTVSSKSTS